MKFLLDNNLPLAAAQALHAIYAQDDHQIFHLRTLFPESVEDVDWIQQARERGFQAVVTKDNAIKKVPQEREAWLRSGLTVFFLQRGWQSLKRVEICRCLVNQWDEIIRLAGHRRRGCGYRVPVKGTKFERVDL
ncbi:MAG TPA: hypothetical protein VGG06_17350 [Thermoanaerobaculia bacterium]